MAKFLIAAHLGDETALRVFSALRSRHGSGDVCLVSAPELSLAPRWCHTLGEGGVATDLALARGTLLRGEEIGVVFNRLRHAEVPQFERASENDRGYAAMETTALWLSFLAGLPCPVVNPPTPRNLGGRDRSRAEWLSLAGRAGLPAAGYRFTTDPRRFPLCGFIPHRQLPPGTPGGPDHFERIPPPLPPRNPVHFFEPVANRPHAVLVAGKTLVGSLPKGYEASLFRLAELSGCDLFEASFDRSIAAEAGPENGDRHRLVAVNPFPILRATSDVSAVVGLLEARRDGAGGRA